MSLSEKRITKALIRLRGYTGWYAPVLFANSRRQVFSCQGQYTGIYDYTERYSKSTEPIDAVNILPLARFEPMTLTTLPYHYTRHRPL